MTKTSPLVDFSLYDTAIKQDSDPSVADIQPFSKVADLEMPGDVQVYGSFEPDMWVLNGRYKLMPTVTTNVHVGLMSLSMSNVSGVFAVPVVLTVNFSEDQSTDGLTLKFSQYTGDWSDNLDIAYYDSSNALIQTDNYAPTTYELWTNEPAVGFRKIVITFNGTNKPYRYLRLLSIDYGQVFHFTAANIKSCVVTEEIDPISVTMPIGTLELEVFSEDADFSIINPAGVYASFAEGQPLDVYEQIDNDVIYIGHFFLKEWENKTETITHFSAVDAVGIIDGIPFLGYLGHLDSEQWTVGFLLSAIFGGLYYRTEGGVDIAYEIESGLESVVINGHIPCGSCRQVLQRVALTIGAYISCSRSSKIIVKQMELASELVTFDYTVTSAEKGLTNPISLALPVNGVELTYHNYLLSINDDYELYKNDHTAGTFLIRTTNSSGLGTSLHPGDITGATFVQQWGLFNIISVPSPGTVTIVGYTFEDAQEVYKVYDLSLPVNKRKNIVVITDVNTVTPSNASTIAQRIYDYYQQRYIINYKTFAPRYSVGDSALVDTLYNRQIGGIVERMKMDLVAGFACEVKVRGVVIDL
jgi:hypothetical protein